MSSNRLLNMLVAPSKVATVLDWKKAGGSILNIDIHSDRIGLALGLHPAVKRKADNLEPIPLLSRGRLPPNAKNRLKDIMENKNVCGIIVSWPVQEDTGRNGAACGRVCHTLEELLSDPIVFSPRQPLCLWDSKHSYDKCNEEEKEDQWGRTKAYSRTCDKNIHLASAEQYHQNANIMATQVWDDFIKTHWPQFIKPN